MAIDSQVPHPHGSEILVSVIAYNGDLPIEEMRKAYEQLLRTMLKGMSGVSLVGVHIQTKSEVHEHPDPDQAADNRKIYDRAIYETASNKKVHGDPNQVW